jgi:peptidoglycan/xylan/chitin deacetylase (PgdA/CDA1 family)
MRLLLFILICAASVMVLTGCGTTASKSQWRRESKYCFKNALSEGAETLAPEETDNIRQSLSVADRLYKHKMLEDADSLYQLSTQKCKLLYRNLIVLKRSNEPSQGTDPETVSQKDVLKADERSVIPNQPVLQSEPVVEPSSQPTAARGKTVERKKKLKRSTASQSYSGQPPDSGRRHIKPAETTIYLTFDDGPSNLTVPIASYLNSEGIPATFFVLGQNIKGREKAVTATIAMGHQVGNHTYSHNLQKLTNSLVNDSSEIKRAGDMIERLGGDGKMVRIPYGASSKSILTHVSSEGAQVFDWDINSKDSTHRGSKDHLLIEKTVIGLLNKNSKKHVVLLFHDGAGHDSTLTALKDLIPRLKQDGYQFGLLARGEKIARLKEGGRRYSE